MSSLLLDWMRETGNDTHGATISVATVREILGIEDPKIGTRKQFQELELRELAAVRYASEILLDEGKYLGKVKDTYRISLPSENAARIADYHAAARRKLNRAARLQRSSEQLSQPYRPGAGRRAMLLEQDANSASVYGRPLA